ncbi:MAG: hypothetical protein KJO26_10715, partial [Deltaproteobacteria bacterium]|nr:hypothetical protein [Deltaproteobacteria bacterium]
VLGDFTRFIAVTHNLAEVWVAHITLERNVISGILHLEYKTSITTFSGFQKLRYVGVNADFHIAWMKSKINIFGSC